MENDLDVIRRALDGEDDAAEQLDGDWDDTCESLCCEVEELREEVAGLRKLRSKPYGCRDVFLY